MSNQPPDPVVVEIIRNALTSAAEDMNNALIRSAYTPIIYECGDAVVALLDAEHQILGQSSGVPLFLGNLEVCSQMTEQSYGREVWQPGDVWALNDSYIGGTHLNDVSIYGPVFVDDELVGFAASRAHWIDVGSKDPGGSMDSISIFQEGLRLAPVKIVEGGELVASLVDVVAHNVRLPYATVGDLKAQVACVRLGQQRLHELIERFGRHTVEQARDVIFAQTEALERAVVAEISDGSYRADGRIDNDGIDLASPIAIAVTITVEGSDMTVDLTQSSDQATGPVNCGVAQAVSATRLGYKLLVSPELPGNGGSFRALQVLVREGSVLGAQAPAACQWYFTHLGLLIDLMSQALAEVIPDRVAAASYGDSMIIQVSGTDPRTHRPYVGQEATVGGWGAWQESDGESALINSVNGALKSISIEVYETRYPLRITTYRMRPDSGGAGQWRGGNGVIREYQALADGVVSLWFERSIDPAWGLFGGSDAAPPEVVINPGRDGERRLLKINQMPVINGDVIRLATGGGGGFGDPAQRDPEAIKTDLADGMITTMPSA